MKLSTPVLSSAMIAILALNACGGGNGDGGGAADDGGNGDGGNGDAGGEMLTEVDVAAGAERVPYRLQAGRYRLSWRAPDCEDPQIVVTPASGEPIFDQSPPIATVFVSGVTEGEYFVEQTNAACEEWTITMVRISS